MKEQLAILLFVLLSNVHLYPLAIIQHISKLLLDYQHHPHTHAGAFLLAEAKGVAGLGKAGGEGQGGADKAGQQVPPEVYMALTYAGTLFLFTLSVPLILYGLNKLLNKIEDCFGCGPSSRSKNKTALAGVSHSKTNLVDSRTGTLKPHSNGRQQTLIRGEIINVNQHQAAIDTISGSLDQHQSKHQCPQIASDENTTKQYQHNQRLHLQMLQQYPKYTQFISMSSPNYNPPTAAAAAAVHVSHSSPTRPLAPGNVYPLHPSGGSPASRNTNNSFATHNISPDLNSNANNKYNLN